MIDFQNASFVKLKRVHDDAYSNIISPIFIDGEVILGTFQAMRDGVVFTNKRIISINIPRCRTRRREQLLHSAVSRARAERYPLRRR